MDLSTKMDLSSILEGITCPITRTMVEAVSGNDGHTYEKNAIVHALSLKAESPMTRQPMTQNDLKVNTSIQFLCDKYHREHLEILHPGRLQRFLKLKLF